MMKQISVMTLGLRNLYLSIKQSMLLVVILILSTGNSHGCNVLQKMWYFTKVPFLLPHPNGVTFCNYLIILFRIVLVQVCVDVNSQY